MVTSKILVCGKLFDGLTDMRFGFTTMRDMGTFDPEWPGLDLRNAIDAGLLVGPRLIVAGHMISASGGHADARRISVPVSPRSFKNGGFARQDPGACAL